MYIIPKQVGRGLVTMEKYGSHG